MALLAIAPTALIGCSGGSSSNNSASNTGATFTSYTPELPNFLAPLNLRGALKPQKSADGVPDLSKGSGIYSYYTPTAGQSEGIGTVVNIAVLNTAEESRQVSVLRKTRTGLDVAVGTVYTANTGLSIQFFRRFNGETPAPNQEFVMNSGSARVTSIKGNYVTLEVTDAQMVAITPDPAAPRSFTLNGTLTYKRSDVEELANGF